MGGISAGAIFILSAGDLAGSVEGGGDFCGKGGALFDLGRNNLPRKGIGDDS